MFLEAAQKVCNIQEDEPPVSFCADSLALLNGGTVMRESHR